MMTCLPPMAYVVCGSPYPALLNPERSRRILHKATLRNHRHFSRYCTVCSSTLPNCSILSESRAEERREAESKDPEDVHPLPCRVREFQAEILSLFLHRRRCRGFACLRKERPMNTPLPWPARSGAKCAQSSCVENCLIPLTISLAYASGKTTESIHQL
jgi:hypothetical protein